MSVAVAAVRAKIRGLMWVATLEENTCMACRAYHGRVWRVDRGPRPTLHIGCQCVMVPVLKGEPEPDLLDADDWLRTQGPDFQDAALGPARAKLWRQGKVGSVRDLTNMRGRTLTLAELAERE